MPKTIGIQERVIAAVQTRRLIPSAKLAGLKARESPRLIRELTTRTKEASTKRQRRVLPMGPTRRT